MKNNDKTKEQLLKELEKSNKRIAELEKSETEPNQAEEELRLHTAMMDNVAEGIYLIGLDDLIIKWTNEKFERMFGYDPGEIVGKQVDIVNAPTERTPTETRISIVDVLKETGEWHGEVRNIKHDGTHFWCYANVSLFDHPEYGKVIVSVHTDITEHKQAEIALRESEARFKSIFSEAPIGIEYYDSKGSLIDINKECMNIFGVDDKEETKGFKLFEDPNLSDESKRQVREGKPFKYETEFDFELVKELKLYKTSKSGKCFLNILITPYETSELNEIGYLVHVEDITKRKQAEKALRIERDNLKNIFSAIEDGIYIVNQQYDIQYVNSVLVKDFGVYEGRKCYDYFHDRTEVCPWCKSPDVFAGKTVRWEWFSSKNGKTYDLIDTPLKNPDGSISKLEIFRDITERKQAEDKEKKYYKNIELLSETAMQFVEFPQDKDIYTFIGEQLGELIGKDSYFVINTIDEKSILTTRAVLGIGKFTDKIVKLMGRHPVGTTLDAKDKNLSELSDGKLHLNEEGLSGIFLKTVPKTVCNSLEKLLNIKKTYGIGFTKDGELFGTIVIILKEGAGELKNKQTIETFIKQASIAIQKRQVEEVLKESKENFQQVISNITTVVWKADIGKNGAFKNTYSSPVLDEILDLPAGTMKNNWDKYFSYIKPEYLERVNNAFREAIISPGKKINCEYEVLKDNGQTAWFQSIGRCFEKNGKLHVFGSTTDITKRKQAEAELLLKDLVFEHSVAANSISDNAGIITHVNDTFIRIWGYESRNETIGKPIGDFLRFEDEAKKIITGLNETGVWKGEYTGLRKNGTTFIAYGLATIIKDGSGDSIGYQSAVLDITDRKKAEEDVRKLSKVVETTPDAVVITDMQGTIEYVNQGLLTLGGFKNNNLIIGKPVFMFSNEEGVKKLQEEIIPTILSDGKWRGEVPVKRKDGSVFPADMVCSLILDEEGKPKYLLSQYHDITKRKKAEEELRDKINELEAFYRTTLGREGRVIELKQEVNELLEQLGKRKKYKAE